MPTSHASAAWLAVCSLLFGLTACSEAKPATNDLVIVDVSRSSVKASTNIVPEAQALTSSLVEAMTPDSRVTVVGFNNRPGSPCLPLEFDYPKQDNSEQEKQLKSQLLARVEGDFQRYIACLTSDEYGSSTAGSSIFGALPDALVQANATGRPVTRIYLNTDGCTFREGPATCSERLSAPGFAKGVLDALPASLKPDLASVDLLVVHGLGQGTALQSAVIAVLQEIWTLYGKATNIRVTFD